MEGKSTTSPDDFTKIGDKLKPTTQYPTIIVPDYIRQGKEEYTGRYKLPKSKYKVLPTIEELSIEDQMKLLSVDSEITSQTIRETTPTLTTLDYFDREFLPSPKMAKMIVRPNRGDDSSSSSYVSSSEGTVIDSETPKSSSSKGYPKQADTDTTHTTYPDIIDNNTPKIIQTTNLPSEVIPKIDDVEEPTTNLTAEVIPSMDDIQEPTTNLPLEVVPISGDLREPYYQTDNLPLEIIPISDDLQNPYQRSCNSGICQNSTNIFIQKTVEHGKEFMDVVSVMRFEIDPQNDIKEHEGFIYDYESSSNQKSTDTGVSTEYPRTLEMTREVGMFGNGKNQDNEKTSAQNSEASSPSSNIIGRLTSGNKSESEMSEKPKILKANYGFSILIIGLLVFSLTASVIWGLKTPKNQKLCEILKLKSDKFGLETKLNIKSFINKNWIVYSVEENKLHEFYYGKNEEDVGFFGEGFYIIDGKNASKLYHVTEVQVHGKDMVVDKQISLNCLRFLYY